MRKQSMLKHELSTLIWSDIKDIICSDAKMENSSLKIEFDWIFAITDHETGQPTVAEQSINFIHID